MQRFETKKKGMTRAAKAAMLIIGILTFVFVLLPWVQQIFFHRG